MITFRNFKVDPEGDIKGSYGKKLYNHSCIEFINHLNRKGKSIQGMKLLCTLTTLKIIFLDLKSSYYTNAMIFHISGNDYESKFIRTCPVGVKSCFGAKGFYDRDDEKVSNDICKLIFSRNRNCINDLGLIWVC